MYISDLGLNMPPDHGGAYHPCRLILDSPLAMESGQRWNLN